MTDQDTRARLEALNTSAELSIDVAEEVLKSREAEDLDPAIVVGTALAYTLIAIESRLAMATLFVQAAMEDDEGPTYERLGRS